MKNCTVTRAKSGKYFVSIQCEVEVDKPDYQGEERGVDMGLVVFATLADSEGQVEEIANPRYLGKAEKRLKRLQRRLSRSRKGSKGYEKVRLLLARQHEMVANQRRDFQHKQSRRLVDHNRLLCFENLHIAGMLKNHRVSKSISDAAWGEFVRQCSYKGEWYGCDIEIVGRFFPSSKLCNVCDRKNAGLKLSDRNWVCAWCRTVHKRDANAARNVLAEGKRNGRAGAAQTIQVNAGGEGVRPGIALATPAASVKPEAQSLLGWVAHISILNPLQITQLEGDHETRL